MTKKIETLRTVPGEGTMHPPGSVLEVGVDVSGAIARGWVQSGKAAVVGGKASGRKTRAPGAPGSDSKLETRD